MVGGVLMLGIGFVVVVSLIDLGTYTRKVVIIINMVNMVKASFRTISRQERPVFYVKYYRFTRNKLF